MLIGLDSCGEQRADCTVTSLSSESHFKAGCLVEKRVGGSKILIFCSCDNWILYMKMQFSGSTFSFGFVTYR